VVVGIGESSPMTDKETVPPNVILKMNATIDLSISVRIKFVSHQAENVLIQPTLIMTRLVVMNRHSVNVWNEDAVSNDFPKSVRYHRSLEF
jgi:hypothetical protein